MQLIHNLLLIIWDIIGLKNSYLQSTHKGLIGFGGLKIYKYKINV